MTVEVVNLRRARKARARATAEREAAANRVLHGRSKAERAVAEAETRRQSSRLDAHRIPGAEERGEE